MTSINRFKVGKTHLAGGYDAETAGERAVIGATAGAFGAKWCDR